MNMSEPTKKLEAFVRDRILDLMNNPVLPMDVPERCDL